MSPWDREAYAESLNEMLEESVGYLGYGETEFDQHDIDATLADEEQE